MEENERQNDRILKIKRIVKQCSYFTFSIHNDYPQAGWAIRAKWRINNKWIIISTKPFENYFDASNSIWHNFYVPWSFPWRVPDLQRRYTDNSNDNGRKGDMLDWQSARHMMTSSNGNIFSVTGPLCVEFTGQFPLDRPVTRSFDVLFDLRLNWRLSKQSWDWWFETPSRSLWRHRNEYKVSFNQVIPKTINDNWVKTGKFAAMGPWIF